jgi:hypothetical protein
MMVSMYKPIYAYSYCKKKKSCLFTSPLHARIYDKKVNFKCFILPTSLIYGFRFVTSYKTWFKIVTDIKIALC